MTTPIRDALDRVGREGFDLTAEAGTAQEPTVTVSGAKFLGRGWSLTGAGQWARSQWSTFVGLRWRPKGDPS